MLRVLGYLFTVGFIVFLAGAGVVSYVIWQTSQDLPEYSQLAEYEPPVMTRIHAGDGSLLSEFATERRLFVPYNAVPRQLVEAYLSAEDKNFYHHGGIDPTSVARAVVVNVQNLLQGGRRLVGASTITQQVAKNFLLSGEQTVDRKLKEALLAIRMERAFTKQEIIELYLNEIYLGLGSYGIAAAALNYFSKPLNELTLPEMAYLAALPKAPNNYHPFREPERALARRNWVLRQMQSNGYITAEEAEEAIAAPLEVRPRRAGADLFAAEYFAEEVRQTIVREYGEEKLYEGGLSVRTTLDPKLQIIARRALTNGLIKFDRERGFRGPVDRIATGGDWGAALVAMNAPSDLRPWRLGVVLDVDDDGAEIGIEPNRLPGGRIDETRQTGRIPLELLSWAREARGGRNLGPEITSARQVLEPGDVIYVAPSSDDRVWHLVQVPRIDGGLVAMDPHTGRVLAMAGGFSFGRSQFNRVTQARRQPGSAFKPFVYAAALDNGYTPSSVVLDAPISITMPNGDVWEPKNYSGRYYGPSTLRRGIELSRNTMTVRLARDMGIETVGNYAKAFGIYDEDTYPHLSIALGAAETTVLRLVAAYAMLDNGGKKIEPTLIDRIQDRYGRTIYRHDGRDCVGCRAEENEWRGQPEPNLPDDRQQLIDPYTAYQITSMMEGVVERGTGRSIARVVQKPLAGKTGTTNQERDAWFVGFAPDLAVGVYIGYDNPQPMGGNATGGAIAAPIFADFMKMALQDKSAIPFRVPDGIQLIPIDANTGQRAAFGEEDVILEPFKPGEGPPEDTFIIGAGPPVSQGEQERSIMNGGLRDFERSFDPNFTVEGGVIQGGVIPSTGEGGFGERESLPPTFSVGGSDGRAARGDFGPGARGTTGGFGDTSGARDDWPEEGTGISTGTGGLY